MAKNYKTELKNRKFKSTNSLYYFIYYIVMHIVGRKYHAHYEIIDDVRDCKGPCFVIFNHLSRIDHFYVNEICYPKKVNMLSGYNEFFRSHLYFAFKKNNILPKKQYDADLSGTKAMMQIIKQGGSVALAPEGLATNDGLPRPVVPKTGNLFKHYKIPVYHVKLSGQYLQNTKHCLDVREGETYAKVYKLFTPEELEKLTVEEIDEKINEAFRFDEYAWQKEHKILWKTNGRICEKLDDLLYECPKCHTRFMMEAKDNHIRCKNCGNGTTMDDYYDFHPYENSIIPEKVSDWVNEERISVIREIRKNPDFVFTQNVKIGKIPDDHLIKDKKTSEIVGEGLLTIDHNGVRYKGKDTDKYDFDLSYKKIYTVITEIDSSYFNLYVNGEYTDIFPENNVVIYINYLIEEMHRLHVNFYKNFKWNSWMYENLD